MTLTVNEREIMDLLWKEARPLTRSEIITLCTNKSWKEKSIHILLNSLLEKDAISVDGFARSGKNFGRTYIAAIAESDYIAMQLANTLPPASNTRVTIPGIISALVNNHKIDSGTIDELEHILEQKKKEINAKAAEDHINAERKEKDDNA